MRGCDQEVRCTGGIMDASQIVLVAPALRLCDVGFVQDMCAMAVGLQRHQSCDDWRTDCPRDVAFTDLKVSVHLGHGNHHIAIGKFWQLRFCA